MISWIWTDSEEEDEEEIAEAKKLMENVLSKGESLENDLRGWNVPRKQAQFKPGVPKVILSKPGVEQSKRRPRERENEDVALFYFTITLKKRSIRHWKAFTRIKHQHEKNVSFLVIFRTQPKAEEGCAIPFLELTARKLWAVEETVASAATDGSKSGTQSLEGIRLASRLSQDICFVGKEEEW